LVQAALFASKPLILKGFLYFFHLSCSFSGEETDLFLRIKIAVPQVSCFKTCNIAIFKKLDFRGFSELFPISAA